MRLLGIEFSNFARFEKAFIPLDTGIRLLAGKNNSGKTALLRGLSALTALPFGSPASLSPEIGRYAQSQKPQPNYPMDVYFEYEPKDMSLVSANLDIWPGFNFSANKKWVFSFQVFPRVSAISLVAVKLHFEKTVVPFVEQYGPALHQFGYDDFQRINGRVAINSTGSGSQINEGPSVKYYAATGLFSEFRYLNKTRIVNAHRVVRPNLGLQSLEELSENADSLAPYLDTILSNDRETFDKIQSVVTNIFPEFKLVNPEKTQNSVSITLTLAKTGQKIPLTHCGTGVEQILALATFVLTAEPGTLILLDEPHSYLHPSAERQVTDFLLLHSELRYVIATHSAILINSVDPDRILVLGDSNAIPFTPSLSSHHPIASLIHSLGYRNSDLLFNDRLIFVEGESDKEILPLLLAQDPVAPRTERTRTGFPVMDGEGKLRGRQQQTSLLYWEKFLSELGKLRMPRVYLFDGGCIQEDQKLLAKSSTFKEGSTAYLRFLKMHEIENYLLIPEVILTTLNEIGEFQGQAPINATVEAISQSIQDCLTKRDDKKLFPNGVISTPLNDVKGSVVLEKLFEAFGFVYDKKRTGRLIATKINAQNQPALNEIWNLFPAEFFGNVN